MRSLAAGPCGGAWVAQAHGGATPATGRTSGAGPWCRLYGGVRAHGAAASAVGRGRWAHSAAAPAAGHGRRRRTARPPLQWSPSGTGPWRQVMGGAVGSYGAGVGGAAAPVKNKLDPAWVPHELSCKSLHPHPAACAQLASLCSFCDHGG
ncbi:unnamed protein product [Urochloa humidicola]